MRELKVKQLKNNARIENQIIKKSLKQHVLTKIPMELLEK